MRNLGQETFKKQIEINVPNESTYFSNRKNHTISLNLKINAFVPNFY